MYFEFVMNWFSNTRCIYFFFLSTRSGTTVPMPTTPEVTSYCYSGYFEQEIDVSTQTQHSEDESQTTQLVQVTNATWVDKVKFTSDEDATPIGVLKPKTNRVSLFSLHNCVCVAHHTCGQPTDIST